jgi:hypothetical protein
VFLPSVYRSRVNTFVVALLVAIIVGLVVALVVQSRSGSTKPPDLRGAIREEIQREVGALRTEQDVDAYLDRLERRARERGVVTAVEIEPGFAAIDRLTGDGGSVAARKRVAFGARMERLQAELHAESRAEGKR